MVPATVSLLAALLVPFVISLASRAFDSHTVATFRRSLAATLAGVLLWLLCCGIGLAWALATGSGQALGNSLVFGAFLCGGFEALIIGGAFMEQASVSTLLGALQPAVVMAGFLLTGGIGYSGYAAVPGVVAFALPAAFTSLLKRKRTSRGHNAVKLFQAFMKTWANKDAAGLESIISTHAEKAQVASKVLRFQSTGGDLFFVLPGIHPGPFYPVGSYNLPGLISRAFEGAGQVLTLHRPGGHERNLATNGDAKEYVQKIREFASTLNSTRPATIRGPTAAKVGRATTTTFGFARTLLMTVSFAPYGSDDLELDFEKRLETIASDDKYDIGVIDAHNSIEDGRETTDPADPQWRKLVLDAERLEPTGFRMGFSHSQEKEFSSSEDITSKGIDVVVFEVGGTKWVLALADANNAVPGLRSAVSTALESSGYRLLEFCTSDSHDLAARGLTVNRGYKALGEATPVGAIADSTMALAKLAESRLTSCSFASGTMSTDVNLFGASALDEFANITRSSSLLAKSYARFGALGLVALLLLSLLA